MTLVLGGLGCIRPMHCDWSCATSLYLDFAILVCSEIVNWHCISDNLVRSSRHSGAIGFLRQRDSCALSGLLLGGFECHPLLYEKADQSKTRTTILLVWRGRRGEPEQRAALEPGLDDNDGVEHAVADAVPRALLGGGDAKVVLDPGHDLALRRDHPSELQLGTAAFPAAVVLVDGEPAELLHLPVALHVPHLRPAPHLPPSGAAASQLPYTGPARLSARSRRRALRRDEQDEQRASGRGTDQTSHRN